MIYTNEYLKQLQSLPLEAKINITKQRIRDWYNYYDGQVYVSFSGGKDSTVLLYLARSVYSDIEAVFVNTGLEYPEIQRFVKSFDNVTILTPKIRFDEVIKQYGYPVINKEVSECVNQGKKALANGKDIYRLQKLNGTAVDKQGRKSRYNKEKYKPLLDVDFNVSSMCCNVMKKAPLKQFFKEKHKYPITAQMAEESNLRKQQWLKNGCNGFKMKSPISNPMSFWTEQDVLNFIKKFNIKIASVYGEIEHKKDNAQMRFDDFNVDNYLSTDLHTTKCHRTGCMFCLFGAHLDKQDGIGRFELLKTTHPRQYEYCMGGGGRIRKRNMAT